MFWCAPSRESRNRHRQALKDHMNHKVSGCDPLRNYDKKILHNQDLADHTFLASMCRDEKELVLERSQPLGLDSL